MAKGRSAPKFKPYVKSSAGHSDRYVKAHALGGATKTKRGAAAGRRKRDKNGRFA